MVRKTVTAHRAAFVVAGLAALGGAVAPFLGLIPIPFIVVPAMVYIGARLATGLLPGLIARVRCSIRWKILVVIALMAALLSSVAIVNYMAMDYMHDEVHHVRELAESRPSEVLPALDALEDNRHGLLFSLTPYLTLLGSLLAICLGLALALSVIEPVRRMGQAMRGIAAGDFSQPVLVTNRDELGELADRIDETARELAQRQETTVAAERARGLQERVAQVTLVLEEERRRISRELHDGLGPSLAALANRLRACHRQLRSDPEHVGKEIEEAAKALKGHVQEIRHLIYDLRPLSIEQMGLKGAIQEQVDRFSEDTGIRVSCSIPDDILLNSLTEVTVFRVVQECLSNIQKHANAQQVEINFKCSESGLELRIRDDGQGFDPEQAGLGRGVGLAGMRERAEVVGGRLSIRSRPGGGCEVVLDIPGREAEVGAHPNPAS